MASSGRSLSNADFARMYQQQTRDMTEDNNTKIKQKNIAVHDSEYELNSIKDAAMRRRQEMDLTDSDKDLDKTLQDFGLEVSAHLEARDELDSFPVSFTGLRPIADSRVGLEADKSTNGATPVAKMAKSTFFSWEKHTTGFGTKMLAKMGFKGRLGKKEDGVSATIEVKKRPAQMGMGYGDFVEASNLKQNRKLQKELKGEIADKIDESARDNEEDDTLWRRRTVVASRKKHKRAADLVQEVQDMKRQKKSDVVLDMRGPSVRVLSDVTAAFDVDPLRVAAVRPKLGDELIYNVRMVVNVAQGNIVDLSQKIDANMANAATIKREATMMKSQLSVDDVRLQHMQVMLEQLKVLDTLRYQALGMLSVEPILSQLHKVRENFPLEFDAHELQQLVPSLCMPPLRALLAESNLLEQKSSDSVVLQFRLLQAFLTELPSSRTTTDANKATNVLPVIREKSMARDEDLYNFVLEETLWPAIVQFVKTEWQVKSAPFACVDVFLKIRPHLSSKFEDAFLHQLVLPRLKKECQCWDPRSDKILIQDWLLPWLPYVGSAMKSLYLEIRLTLGNALNQWHPSDLSVLSVLPPWRELWGDHEYGKFTHRNIVRKLIRCLHREFEINPGNQSLEVLTWVLAWKDYLPDQQFIALLEGEFFSTWLNVLRKWIAGSPNLIELEKWYCGWKILFENNSLAANERLLVHFQGALVLLQAATESVGVPIESRPPVPEVNEYAATNYQDALALARDETMKEPSIHEAKMSPRSVFHSVSLKDVIENLAINHNMTFMPKGLHDGQQIYSFGKHQIILEQGVVYMEQLKGVFKPVDLDQLV